MINLPAIGQYFHLEVKNASFLLLVPNSKRLVCCRGHCLWGVEPGFGEWTHICLVLASIKEVRKVPLL